MPENWISAKKWPFMSSCRAASSSPHRSGIITRTGAIAFTEGSVRHIFFVAETKGNTDSLELRGVENAKIECARRHFAAISNEEVVYEVVDSFEKLMQKVI